MTSGTRPAGQHMTSVRELLRDLSPDAERLLTAASVFREPVPVDALPTGAGRLAGFDQPGETIGLCDLVGECAAAGLVTVSSATQRPTVQVASEIAAGLHAHLARADRGGVMIRAHRHAANYWQWRAAALARDWRSEVHDLLEARHHLIEAEDLHPAETITEDVCSRLHAVGAYTQERNLIGDILARVPGPAPRQPAWFYRLGKACHLQADDAEAEHWFRQALAGFERLADTRGQARCYGYLGALAQAHGDYAEAERCYLRSHALERSPGPAGQAAAGERSEPDERTRAPETAPTAAGGGAPIVPARAGGPGLAIPMREGEGTGRPHRAVPSRDARSSRLRARMIMACAGRGHVLATVLTAVAVLATGAALAALPARHRSANRRPEPALTAAVAARNEAAAWIARWGADDAIVSCDPLMCSVLQAHGWPAARLLEITSATADPLGSDLVAATAAVRGRFGGRLGAVYAPEVIASFGSGNARIDVRVVAADGAAAYRGALRADLAARRLAGVTLLGNRRISATAVAARQLAGGRVDSRLMITLAALAASRPVAVIAFRGAGPGSTAGLPLLSAEITVGVIRPGGPMTAGPARAAARLLPRLAAFLHAQRPPLLAAHVGELTLSPGLPVLRIDFTAPSPLGLLVGAASAATAGPLA
ncbi:MAG TPA: tetratricopeptide repeat protein [Streptosporangiaceae bacterium]|nr:tetratricopeptide repeat protein [Streptosporangiaceae bacterium]